MKNKILVIFDDSLNFKHLKSELKKSKGILSSKVFLFSFTSNWDLIQRAIGVLKGLKYIKFEVIDSSRLIDQELRKIKHDVAKWSTKVGLKRIKGKTLREWFAINERVSLWWFSLIAEKNTLKTDLFLKIAQIKAIERFIGEQNIGTCVVCHKDLFIKEAIYSILDKNNIRCKKSNLLNLLFSLTHFSSVVFGFVKGVGYWIRTSLRSIIAKIILCNLKAPFSKQDIVFITYFPMLDKNHAQHGKFINKMVGPLQQRIKEMGKRVRWVAMYIPYDNLTYLDAVKLIKLFRKNGESINILEEFISFKALFKVFLIWIEKCLVYLRIRNKINKKVLCSTIISDGSYYLIKRILDWSLAGWTSMAGLIFFIEFKRMFVTTRGTSKYVYYAEMHEWEKALNYAKLEVSDDSKIIGFQHTNIADNLFHYLWTPEDISLKHKYHLPFPDIFVCDGSYPLQYIKRNGAKELTIAESIRYLYLKSVVNNDDTFSHKKKNVILFAGSISYKETKAMLSFFKASNLPTEKDIKIWLKGHPSCPLDKILKELNFQVENSPNIVICNKPVNELLRNAMVVIVGSSTVALEALANLCNVIVPILPDVICANPLAGFEHIYYKVFTPQQLREVIFEILSYRRQPQRKEVQEVIENYWCLDDTLIRWERLLS